MSSHPNASAVLTAVALGLALTLWACAYTLPVKDGPTAYDLKQYDRAIPMLQAEYGKAKSRQERGPLAYKIGDAYRRTGRFEQAAQWFDKATRDNYGPEALRAYAFALKNAERYAEAREAFKNLSIEIGSPYEYRKEITACTIAEDWIKQIPYEGWSIEQAPFNSPANDFAPVILPDGRIVFSSDRAMSQGERKYDWTGLKFTDLYIVSPENASPQSFDAAINTEAHEGTACFSANASEIFFVRTVSAYKGDDAFCKIHYARREGPNWSEPTPLPFQKERVNYLHPALSADGATLYFAANDPEGWGGYDIYAAKRNPRIENQWDAPLLLGRNINTAGNELFPSLHADTLYFASDGHTGMGGLDIFRSHKVEKMGWTPPLNLKAPLNSGADDFAFAVAEQRQGQKPGDLILSGYFSSNRPGGRGGDDIYRFERRIPPPRPTPPPDTLPAAPARIVLEVYVLEKIFSVPDDPNSRIIGRKPL
ncbi:MAG: flagellar motor protein MotB, partial [Saprospiraceae bacterium]